MMTLALYDTFLTPLAAQPNPSPTDLGEVTEKVTEGVGKTVYGAGPLLGTLLAVGIAVLVAGVVTVVLALVLKQVFKKSPQTLEAAKRMRTPTFLAALFMTGKITLDQIPIEGFNLMSLVQWILLFAGLGAIGWLLVNAVRTGETAIMTKYEGASVTDRRARKIQTQTVLIRRILIMAIVVLLLSIALLTIPAVRAVGAGLMASAGILSVIAGLAVQSSLANVFAGLQIVFTDAIRVGDVVQVEEYFGTVEDITLTYVVVKIWDERRVIYPSTFFTTNSFENYTRTGASATGTVELEMDWSAPVDQMRTRLRQLLESTQLWDGREKSIQVTEALGGMIKVRIVVSAANTGNLWDLRSLVREDMINFLRNEHPQSIYRQRFTSEEYSEGAGRQDDQEQEQHAPTGKLLVEPEPQTSRLRTLDNIFAEGTPARGSLPRIAREAELKDAEKHEAEEETWQDSAAHKTEQTTTAHVPLTTPSPDSAMFTGSITALERGLDYLGPGEEAYKQRQERIADDGDPGEETEDEKLPQEETQRE